MVSPVHLIPQTILEEGTFNNTQRTQINDNFSTAFSHISTQTSSILNLENEVNNLNIEVNNLNNVTSFIPFVAPQITNVTKTSDTTLENLGTLSANLNANSLYYFVINIQANSTVNGGINVAVNFGATLSNFSASVITGTGITLATGSGTGIITLKSELAAANTLVAIGTMTVTNGGGMTIQGAQNTSSVDTTTFYGTSSLALTYVTSVAPPPGP